MLVLVVGATGNMGQQLIDALLARGHSVRAAARNPSKLTPERMSALESFVQIENYHDVAGLDRACAGVQAVICAYAALLELQLEGQLLLLRAAERAGVKIFVSSSWNFDWRGMALGEHEIYDPFISLHNHAAMTSNLNVIFIFTGMLAEVLFSVPGRADFSPEANGVWSRSGKFMELWGTGDEVWHWTTEEDAAKFTVAIIEHEDAEKGGFWSVCSGGHTLKEMAAVYGRVRGQEVEVRIKGTEDDLRRIAVEARRQGSTKTFWTYIGYFVQLFTIDGTWVLKDIDNKRLNVEPTTLEQFFLSNPDI